MRDMRWPFAKSKDVRGKALSETHGKIELSSDQPSPELAAALAVPKEASPDVLGEPMGLGEVAQLIGCSAWTVRQRYVPAGLPHFRLGPNGKLIFYKNQIIRWLLTQQQKGGQVV